MKREYDSNLSREENLAIEILECARIKKYSPNRLHYEIVNYPPIKKVFFTCVISSTNISLIEYYLNEFVDAKFIDKSNIESKRYLTVRID
jgi:hypothetical protein